MQSDREKLQLAIVLFMVAIAVAGFAFAWWVHLTEQAMEEPAPMEYAVSEAKMEETTILQSPAVTAPFTQGSLWTGGPDPMCEDTYLRDDLPLDYETQMHLYGACLEFEIDYELALAVIEQETRFQNVAGDGGDSVGFMQIQRKWWKGLMAEIGAADLWDAEDNFRTGCAILRQLLDEYGNLEDALSAYNTGRPGQTRYSRSVMERMQNYG